MMHRIVEAFTRPHYQITGVDELVQAATVIAIILIVVGLFTLFCKLMDKL